MVDVDDALALDTPLLQTPPLDVRRVEPPHPAHVVARLSISTEDEHEVTLLPACDARSLVERGGEGETERVAPDT